MAEEKIVKPLKYKILNGLSEKQLAEHHDVLYAGYVKKTNEIRAKLPSADKENPNATFSEIRELKAEESFALNGVKLHEGYFDNMAVQQSKPNGAILELINRDFGTYENWEKEFKALGVSARGWAILAYDLDDKKLFNVLCDAHNHAGIWNCIALLIMDVYEHAYFVDYATARKKYIDAFFSNIDWNEINGRIEKYGVK